MDPYFFTMSSPISVVDDLPASSAGASVSAAAGSGIVNVTPVGENDNFNKNWMLRVEMNTHSARKWFIIVADKLL